MLRKLTLAAAGAALLGLGLLGLALPFLPGILFLLLAAACFAALSPQLHGWMARHPRLARFFRRLEQGRGLDVVTRAKLAFWAGLEAVANPRVR